MRIFGSVGSFAESWALMGVLFAVLALLGCSCGRFGALLKSFWCFFVRIFGSVGSFGTSWADMGVLDGTPATILGRVCENKKHLQIRSPEAERLKIRRPLAEYRKNDIVHTQRS